MQTVRLSCSLRLCLAPALFRFARSLHLSPVTHLGLCPCFSLLALGFLPQGNLPGLCRSFQTALTVGLSLRNSLRLSLCLGFAICLLFCCSLCLTLAALCSANYMVTRDDTLFDDVAIAHCSVVQLVRGTRQR